LTAISEDHEKIRSEVEEKINQLNEIIPQYIFGYDDDTLEKVIGDQLRSRIATLCTAESCTGGYLAHLITSVPGSSDYFKGSIIAYSNEIKEKILHVPAEFLENHGAVSEQVVVAMAENGRRLLGADYCIALSGIAGPAGGSREKPVGTTWIAISGPVRTVAKKFHFGEHRGRNIRKAALQALNMLREEFIL
jgi:nicotinamide-nucleotide amidase